MQDYERLGAFYLGRAVDPKTGETTDQNLLYDAKDLCTHAVCLGMTGSGKTGLCLSLLEEAAIDGIPVLAIDPKGDIGNLMLGFPDLEPGDFLPWVDPGAALRKGKSVAEFAADTATLWRNGLAAWDQDGERIRRLHASADFAIYTPGSQAGLGLTVLKSFRAPDPQLLEDRDGYRERVQGAASGILALLGIEGDPLRSREHVLIANILDHAWRDGEDLDLPALVHRVQAPPFKTLGVMDLDGFFPPSDRLQLAMQMNNLLASPDFAVWAEGEPLDIQSLLYTKEGKPRVTILSIAHLEERERLFFVSVLLNELISWMRGQPGTTSLRALLYMDEVFGYLPPTANPPTKRPLLTLLKQARAYGVGCVLATQNPVDLDYKALSNAGTWFLGRLQTERDQMRVLDGLQGAASTTGAAFDRKAMETMLSGLKSRVFLMHDVHEDGPVLFQTRWAMSYLRGPMTRAQISDVMADRKALVAASATSASGVRGAVPRTASTAQTAPSALRVPPTVPKGVLQRFVPLARGADEGCILEYRPAIMGTARLHYISGPMDVDLWKDAFLFASLEDDVLSDPWESIEPVFGEAPELEAEADASASYGELPEQARSAKSFTEWQRRLRDHVYRTCPLVLYKCKSLGAVSDTSEDLGEFKIRLAQLARERRDLEVEKLRAKYAPKIQRLEAQILRAQQKVEVQKSQVTQKATQTAITIGASILGALFGKGRSRGIGAATSAVRSASRTAQEHGDVKRAEESLETLLPQQKELTEEFERAAEELKSAFDVDALEIEETSVRPRKSDMAVSAVPLVWTPWSVDTSGGAEPLFD